VQLDAGDTADPAPLFGWGGTRHPDTLRTCGDVRPVFGKRPDWLGPTATRAWDAMMADLTEGGVLDRADSGVVAGAAHLFARAVDAGADIDKHGLTISV
jgi:phage terminase small subunit